MSSLDPLTPPIVESIVRAATSDADLEERIRALEAVSGSVDESGSLWAAVSRRGDLAELVGAPTLDYLLAVELSKTADPSEFIDAALRALSGPPLPPHRHGAFALTVASDLVTEGRVPEAIRLLEDVLPRLEETGEMWDLILANLTLSDLLRVTRARGARESAEAALRYASSLTDQTGIMTVILRTLALALSTDGDPRARNAVESAIQISDSEQDVAGYCDGHVAAARVYGLLGDGKKAIKTASFGTKLGRKLGLDVVQAESWAVLAAAYEIAGSVKKSHAAFEEALRQLDGLGPFGTRYAEFLRRNGIASSLRSDSHFIPGRLPDSPF
ncbi:tetratricopeptide repeat protein [Cnuibacter sp. UC19_7]|uniref:tetratricopeptide repeat protein n=1 Tax=Cnuibacter sp. UC19_7 TaxID=3350166 RepID=UPI003672F80C